jgi:hypothetical protein
MDGHERPSAVSVAGFIRKKPNLKRLEHAAVGQRRGDLAAERRLFDPWIRGYSGVGVIAWNSELNIYRRLGWLLAKEGHQLDNPATTIIESRSLAPASKKRVKRLGVSIAKERIQRSVTEPRYLSEVE